jgi:hypothetical protein
VFLKKTLFLALAALLFSHASFAEEKKGFMNFFNKDTKAQAKKEAAVVTPAPRSAPASETAPAASPEKTGPQAGNTSALKNRMANNNSMTDAEKQGLAEAALRYFPAEADLHSPQFEKDTLRFEQIANDPNMTVAEKKAEIDKYFTSPKEAEPAVPQAVLEKPAAVTQQAKAAAEVQKETKAETPQKAAMAETPKTDDSSKKSSSNFAKKSS